MGEEREAASEGTSRPLFDQVLEVALYAPLGAALRIAEELPSLAAKGRGLAGSQVESARAVGRFAVGTARSRLGRRLGQPGAPRGQGGEPPAPPGAAPGDPGGPGSPPAARPAGSGADRGLAIPGYDALAASQVVPLLAGLSPAELAAVRRHEEEHRRRRTVLGRIEQLEEERSHGEP